MNPQFSVFKPGADLYLNKEVEAVVLAGDCRFTEGPVWNKEGYYLFSDIPANCIYKISETGKKEVYLPQSGTTNPNDGDLNPEQVGSNGLAYNMQGELLVCRHGSHDIACLQNGVLQPLITQYGSQPLNSPNDLVVHRNGRVFFSDPPYGLKEGKAAPQKFQSAAGVYCWSQGTLTCITNSYQYPNGVCLGVDEEELFVCSNKPFERFIHVYDAHTLAFKRVLAEENSDGLKCDRHGNIYLCTKEGLVVLQPNGKRLTVLPLPFIPANCCWGGPGKKDLLVCARKSVFLLKGLLK